MALIDWFLKAKPNRADADEPSSPIFVMSGQSVRFLSTKAISTADVAQRESPQLYRITNFIASSVQSVPWYCEEDPDVNVSEHPGKSKIKAINDLLKSPNDTYTSQQLQYWIALNLMLYARAHFKVGIGTNNNPNGIYPLAAKHVRGVINNRGIVDKYEYGSGLNMTTFPSRRTAERGGVTGIAYAAEIAFPSLTGMVEYNKAPAAIESLSIPLQIIKALMQRALDTASGHPNVKYVITAEKTITRQQKEALTKHLEESASGGEHSGEILFLYNTDVKVHTLDNQLGDIHAKLPLDDMTRQIAGVFGVPVALLGLGSADAAKYASNYVESRLSYWQDTVVPCYLVPIASGMTQSLCPYGARIRFDLDAVPALWEGRANLGKTLSSVTFLTNNEKREVLGFEKKAGEDTLPELKPPTGVAAANGHDGGEHEREPADNRWEILAMTKQWETGDRIQCDLSFTPIQLDATPGLPEGYIAGIASTASTDRHGHKVMAKAFDESIRKKGFAGPSGVQLLIGHDWNKVGGKIKKMETVDDKLLMEAQLYMDVSYVKDVHTVLKQNGGLNFSVGFQLEEFDFNDVMEHEDDPWLIVKKGDLMEVSIVTFPSQKDAVMTFIKELDTVTDFEKALVADGVCDSRSQAHRLTRWAIKNAHLLQPKIPLLGDKAAAAEPHPLLDVSMLKPMAELIAKARAQLP